MKKLILWGSVAGLTSCVLRPQFVAIAPDFAYVDGCVDVTLSGHKLGSEATATIGGEDLPLTPAEAEEDVPDYAQDVGFEYYSRVPPSPTGKTGWVDVAMKVDGEELLLKSGFYYRSCPGTFAVDSFTAPPDPDTTATVTPVSTTPGSPLATGDQLFLAGCGLNDQVKVEFVSMDPAGTARILPPPPLPLPATTPTGDTGTGTTTTPTGDTGGPIITTPTGDTGTPGTTGGTGTPGTLTGTTVCACEGVAVESAPLVSDCSTAQVHADVPALPAGNYCIRVSHPDGTTYSQVDPFLAYYYYYYGYECAPVQTFAVGGAK